MNALTTWRSMIAERNAIEARIAGLRIEVAALMERYEEVTYPARLKALNYDLLEQGNQLIELSVSVGRQIRAFMATNHRAIETERMLSVL